MESRAHTVGSTGFAGAVLLLGVWATVFEGWRTDFIRSFIINTPSGDKIGHVFLYGLLALAFGWASERAWPRMAWLIGPTVAWWLGFADEFRQAGIRGRDTSVADLVANTIGVSVVAIALYGRRRRG